MTFSNQGSNHRGEHGGRVPRVPRGGYSPGY